MRTDEPVEASSGLAKAATLAVPRHEQRSVTDVAEHDGEEEGEADDREDAWVDLAVPRDAVGVDERLGGVQHAPRRGRRGASTQTWRVGRGRRGTDTQTWRGERGRRGTSTRRRRQGQEHASGCVGAWVRRVRRVCGGCGGGAEGAEGVRRVCGGCGGWGGVQAPGSRASTWSSGSTSAAPAGRRGRRGHTTV